MKITLENCISTFPNWSGEVSKRTGMTKDELYCIIEDAVNNPDEPGSQEVFNEYLAPINIDSEGHVIYNDAPAPSTDKPKEKQPKQPREKKPRQPKAKKPAAPKKAKTPKAKKPKAPKKPKVAKLEPTIVTQASTTHNILSRYYALDGLTINAATRKKALSVLTAVQKAIFTRKVRKGTREGELFYQAQKNLIRIANPANEDKTIEIANKSELTSYKRREKSMNSEIKAAMKFVISIARKTADELTDEDKEGLSEVKRLCRECDLPACKGMLQSIAEFEKGERPILAYPIELSGIRHLAGL